MTVWHQVWLKQSSVCRIHQRCSMWWIFGMADQVSSNPVSFHSRRHETYLCSAGENCCRNSAAMQWCIVTAYRDLALSHLWVPQQLHAIGLSMLPNATNLDKTTDEGDVWNEKHRTLQWALGDSSIGRAYVRWWLSDTNEKSSCAKIRCDPIFCCTCCTTHGEVYPEASSD